jgi:hypothetical protein
MLDSVYHVSRALFHSPINASISAYTCLSGAVSFYRDQSPQLFALSNKVQCVFLVLDAAAAVYEAAVVLDRQFALFSAKMPLDHFIGSGAAVASFGWIGVSLAIVHGVHLYFHYQKSESKLIEEIPQNLHGLTMTVSPSMEDTVQGFFYIVRLTTSVALACFGAQSLFLAAVNIGCLSYGIWKISQQKWIQLTYRYADTDPNITPHPRLGRIVQDVVAQYYFPLIPDTREPKEECPICLESEEEAENRKYYFCPDKSYHLLCLPSLFYPKIPQLLQGWQYNRSVTPIVDGNGIVISEIVSYPSTLPRRNLPSCPDCRRNPTIDHQLYFTVRDRQKGLSAGNKVLLRDA